MLAFYVKGFKKGDFFGWEYYQIETYLPLKCIINFHQPINIMGHAYPPYLLIANIFNLYGLMS